MTITISKFLFFRPDYQEGQGGHDLFALVLASVPRPKLTVRFGVCPLQNENGLALSKDEAPGLEYMYVLHKI